MRACGVSVNHPVPTCIEAGAGTICGAGGPPDGGDTDTDGGDAAGEAVAPEARPLNPAANSATAASAATTTTTPARRGRRAPDGMLTGSSLPLRPRRSRAAWLARP